MLKALARIEALLTRRIGLDPAAVGVSLIPRAVRLRMMELGLGDPDAYASLVSSSETELQALIEEVVVPESWFFRDVQPFRLFQAHVRERWAADPERPALRVLSIPCAGGEEPYSIVIALKEIGLPDCRFSVDAVDVSARRLDLARRAVYSANAFRGLDRSIRERYFRECPQGYVLAPAIRDRVRFRQGSILEPGLLADEPPYDVLFCRNLLIYLDPASRQRALVTLDRLLAPDGLLIIGHADRLDSREAGQTFVQVGDPGAFAYRRQTQPEPKRAGALPSLTLTAVTPTAGVGRSPVTPPIAATRGTQVARAALPLPVAVNVPPDVQPSPSLDRVSELANLGRHEEAIALCEQQLHLRGPSAALYFLLGVICQASGKGARAEDCFHKAVYLDPGHDEALLALALLAERRGDRAAAAGFRRRAERAALRKGAR